MKEIILDDLLCLDTHKAVKYLVHTGVKPKHAEAIVETMCEVRKKDIDKLATKEDLQKTESDLKRDMKEMEYRLDHKIDNVKSEMVTEIHKMESSLKTWFLSFMVMMFATVIIKMVI